MASFLSPVAASQFGALEAVLRERLPQSAAMWNVFKYLEHKRFSEKVNTQFYMEGDEDPLVVCVQHQKFPEVEDMVVTMSASASKPCVQIPSNLPDIINWSLPVAFVTIDLDLANSLNLTDLISSQGRVSCYLPLDTYCLHSSESEDHGLGRLPEGIKVKPLVRAEAEIIQRSWKYAGPGALERLEDAIETLGSCGVYIEVENTVKLVSWVFASHVGTLRALHTTEEFRGRGYAGLVMKGSAGLVGKIGAVPVALVELDNVASRALLERLGYTRSGKTLRIEYLPSEDPQ